jgi:hypothetical protein
MRLTSPDPTGSHPSGRPGRHPGATFRSLTGLLFATLAATLLLASCGGGEDPTKAQLRLVNASIEFPLLDLVVDDKRVAHDVAYGQSAEYAAVPAGGPDVEITRAGNATALVSPTPTLTKRRHSTLVAYGAANSLRAVALQDEEGDPDRNTARVRVLNAAPDAGALDVYLTASSEALADVGPVHAGTVVGEPTGFRTIDAKAWRLRVTAAGDATDLRLDIDGVTLASRQVATLVLAAGSGGVLVQALLLTQQGSIDILAGAQARVRAVAGVTASGSVVASAGGVPLLGGSSAPAIGEYRLVPAGATDVRVTVNGADVGVPARDLIAGSDQTLLVWGPSAAPTVSWLADDNRPSSVSSRATLRLVHGVAGLASSLSMTVNFTPRAENVAPGTASVPAAIDASDKVALAVTSPGLTAPLFNATDQTLLSGHVYTLFMIGAAGAPVGILKEDR